MVTASRRNADMFVPNFSRASSAASSAFCTSFRRFAASIRKRETMEEASLTISAESDSGRSGCAVEEEVGVELEGSLVGAGPWDEEVEFPASSRVSDRERVRETRSARPFDAVLEAAEYSFAASP